MPVIPIHVVTTSSGGGFETFGWDSLVVIGTLGLAIATLVLALKTRALADSGQVTSDAARLTAAAAQQELEFLRDQTDAAKRQSRAAEAALNASVLPVLLDIPQHTMFQLPKEMTARPPYRPVGRGCSHRGRSVPHPSDRRRRFCQPCCSGAVRGSHAHLGNASSRARRCSSRVPRRYA
jgi:hypothetical protein